jgi:hypothetical protein
MASNSADGVALRSRLPLGSFAAISSDAASRKNHSRLILEVMIVSSVCHPSVANSSSSAIASSGWACTVDARHKVFCSAWD